MKLHYDRRTKIIVCSGIVGIVSSIFITWFCKKNKIGVKKTRLHIEAEIFEDKT